MKNSQNLPPPLEIFIQGGERVPIVRDIPKELLNLYGLKGSDAYLATSGVADMLFQCIPGTDFSIWYSNYLISENVKIIGRGNFSVMELHFPFYEHFSSVWDGFGHSHLKNRQFEVSYDPFVNNVSEFKSGKRYATFDIHYNRAFLDRYAPHYDIIKKFLDEIDQGRPAKLLGMAEYLSPEMIGIVNEILQYDGDDIMAPLFYESAVGWFTTLLFNSLSGISAEGEDILTKEQIGQVEAARDHLVSDFSRRIGIPVLAQHVGMSECTLMRRFKRVFKNTIYNYGFLARMEHAKFLLVTGNEQISKISLMCGYPDNANFTRAFKTHTGYFPTDYRSKKSKFNSGL